MYVAVPCIFLFSYKGSGEFDVDGFTSLCYFDIGASKGTQDPLWTDSKK